MVWPSTGAIGATTPPSMTVPCIEPHPAQPLLLVITWPPQPPQLPQPLLVIAWPQPLPQPVLQPLPQPETVEVYMAEPHPLPQPLPQPVLAYVPQPVLQPVCNHVEYGSGVSDLRIIVCATIGGCTVVVAASTTSANPTGAWLVAVVVAATIVAIPTIGIVGRRCRVGLARVNNRS